MSKSGKQLVDAPPLFRRLPEQIGVPVRVNLDGEPVDAREGDTVASLLLRTVPTNRYRQSPVSGRPRAPLCMMGVCFECLVGVDGQTNQQGCLVQVRDGMRIRRQMPEGWRS